MKVEGACHLIKYNFFYDKGSEISKFSMSTGMTVLTKVFINSFSLAAIELYFQTPHTFSYIFNKVNACNYYHQ